LVKNPGDVFRDQVCLDIDTIPGATLAQAGHGQGVGAPGAGVAP
jgi:hypothetical protein